MTPNRVPLFALLVVCGFIAGYVLGKYVCIPWRNERRWRRLNIAANARFARQIEMRRQRNAAIRNGRKPRILNKDLVRHTGSGYDFEYGPFGDGGA